MSGKHKLSLIWNLPHAPHIAEWMECFKDANLISVTIIEATKIQGHVKNKPRYSVGR